MTLEVLADWSASDLQTADLIPVGANAAVVLWGDDVDPDGGPSQSLAHRLATGLAAAGEVCFRHDGVVPSRARLVGEVSASRLPWGRTWRVIGGHDPETVVLMFGAAFSQGDQAAIIGAANDDRVLELLRSVRPADLRLREGEVLVAAIVDGAGLLVCAPDAGRLSEVLTFLDKPGS